MILLLNIILFYHGSADLYLNKRNNKNEYLFVPFAYLKALKKLECALYKALLAFILYSNSILCTFKSIQHIHYMIIYTIISCIILYSKSFLYILYSFWSHCEYILSTSVHHQTPGSLAISDLCTLIPLPHAIFSI